MERGSIIRRLMPVLAALFIMTAAAVPVHAASPFTIRRPVITGGAYVQANAELSWTAVRGAKKYEVWRAKTDPKTGAYGAWKKFALTSRTSLDVKADGDYRYRVRGLKGAKKTLWSKPVRIFGASAYIRSMKYSGGKFVLTVRFTNNTDSGIRFVHSSFIKGNQHFISAVNRHGEHIRSWFGTVVPKKGTGIYVDIAPRSTCDITIESNDVSATEYRDYRERRFACRSVFYPNWFTESHAGNKFSIEYSGNAYKSACFSKQVWASDVE